MSYSLIPVKEKRKKGEEKKQVRMEGLKVKGEPKYIYSEIGRVF